MTKDITVQDNILLVEVPEGFFGYNIRENNHGVKILYVSDRVGDEWKRLLPEGYNYTIIGKASELKEDDWKGLVDKHPNIGYKDYNVSLAKVYEEGWTAHWTKNTATASGLSLVKSKGMKLETTLVLIKSTPIT